MRAQKATNSFTRLRQCITYLTPGITSFWRKLSVTSDCQGRSSEVDLQNFFRAPAPGLRARICLTETYPLMSLTEDCASTSGRWAQPSLYPLPPPVPLPAFPPDNRPRPGPASKAGPGGSWGIPGIPGEGGTPHRRPLIRIRTSAKSRRLGGGVTTGTPQPHAPAYPPTDTIRHNPPLARFGSGGMGYDGMG